MRILTICLLLCLACLAHAVENQAYLGIFAETNLMRMAGMPDMSEMMGGMAGMGAMPAGVPIPGMPNRSLTVRLWSPNIAPKSAFATLDIPEGLKLGKQLKLGLYRPEPGKVEKTNDFRPEKVKEFTIKRYWGSSPTVKPGQPLVITWDTLTPEQQAAMREDVSQTSTYFYKPNWTTGYWPTGKQPAQIAKDAVLLGNYALKTNYTGNVEITVPETVRFLDPLALSSPDLTRSIPLDKPITFKWKPIPSVLGYYAFIMATRGEGTLITWSSSEIKTEMDINWNYMQMSDVKAGVARTTIMAPTRIEVTVPAGIFKDCDIVYFTMIGYGTATALAEAQPLPRVQTKTVLTIMLGGTEMEEMGGMGWDD